MDITRDRSSLQVQGPRICLIHRQNWLEEYLFFITVASMSQFFEDARLPPLILRMSHCSKTQQGVFIFYRISLASIGDETCLFSSVALFREA